MGAVPHPLTLRTSQGVLMQKFLQAGCPSGQSVTQPTVSKHWRQRCIYVPVIMNRLHSVKVRHLLTFSVANDVSTWNAVDLPRFVPRQLNVVWTKFIDRRWAHRSRHCNQQTQHSCYYDVKKAKGLYVNIPLLTGKPEQRQFTIQHGILTSISRRQHRTIIGHPLPERTDFGPSLQLDLWQFKCTTDIPTR